jgi:hypothetical protein
VASAMIVSIRSPFWSATPIVTATGGSATGTAGAVSLTVALDRPAVSTVPSHSRPAPSKIETDAPGFSRSTRTR